MAGGHRRRRPESKQKPEIDRVSHPLVKQWRTKFGRLIFRSLPVRIYLLQAEQVEMVDQESADQHNNPADPKQGGQYRPTGWIIDLPDDALDGTPLPEQQ